MTHEVEAHYARASGGLAERIAVELQGVGVDLAALTPEHLETVDEFHIRGRQATLELAARMAILPQARVLDIGSGLGGPARTVAAHYRCHVTGIDLTADFCDAARELSRWVGLSELVDFKQGDATALDVEPASFDAAMTIHAAMNIADKAAVYAGIGRALKPARILAVCDVLQGEGGDVIYPVPWARDASISHLATARQMRRLLTDAGFSIIEEIDSSEESAAWFRQKAARLQSSKPWLSAKIFLGDLYAEMAANQVRNLAERRIRTVTYIARS